MLVLIQRGILRRQIDQVKARLVAMHGVQYDLWSGEGVGGGVGCVGGRVAGEGVGVGREVGWIHVVDTYISETNAFRWRLLLFFVWRFLEASKEQQTKVENAFWRSINNEPPLNGIYYPLETLLTWPFSSS